MLKIVKSALVLLVSFSLCAQTNEISKIVLPKAEAFIQKNKVEGLALGVFYKGKPYFFNFGEASPSVAVTSTTLFPLASVTKVFTASLLALEVQKGKIKLADILSKFFPQLSSTPAGGITLQQLATHTSSLPKQRLERRQKRQNLFQKILLLMHLLLGSLSTR